MNLDFVDVLLLDLLEHLNSVRNADLFALNGINDRVNGVDTRVGIDLDLGAEGGHIDISVL